MTWNLRLVSMRDPEDDEDDNYIEIREVYYDIMGKPMGHCPAPIGGKDLEEIETYIKWALDALNKPVLSFGVKRET